MLTSLQLSPCLIQDGANRTRTSVGPRAVVLAWPCDCGSGVRVPGWLARHHRPPGRHPLKLFFLAPDQRLTDHFVFIGARNMPQEPLLDLLVDERCKCTVLCVPPSVQLDQMVTVINASLEGWRVPHLS